MRKKVRVREGYPPSRFSLLGWVLTASAFQALLALLMSKTSFFYGSTPPENLFDDVHKYFIYASKALLGAIPYRDYGIEYPLLSFPLFFIPRLFTADFAVYRFLFGLEMLLWNGLALYLIARYIQDREGFRRVPGRLAWFTLSFLLLCPLAIARYDLAPMALAFASAVWWFSRKEAMGGITAGVGALLKIFPAAAAAPAVFGEALKARQFRMRGTLAFALTLGMGAGLWLAIGGTAGILHSLQYHLGRGLEIGSLYSGALFLLAQLTGSWISHQYSHSSEALLTPWSNTVAGFTLPLQFLAMGFTLWRFAKSGIQDGVRYAGASVLAFLLTGKVLSPQYILWLLPFIAVLEGKTGERARLLFLLICLATTAIYPWGFTALVNLEPWAFHLLNLRNLLLAALWAILLFGK